VEKGVLREDLYYRLSAFHIPIPPLRERREAIPGLCRTLLKNFCDQAGRDVPRIDDAAMDVLKNYHWPGNVRQLKNEMLRLSVLANGVVSPSLLDSRIKMELVDVPAPEGKWTALQVLERQAIIRTVAVSYNMSDAARKLGLGRQTLYNKISQYGIEKPKKKGHGE